MSRPGLTLSKRERVLKTLAGKEVDRRPFAFWHPFGLTHMKGESLAAAALSFAAAHGMDLVRFPAVRDLPLPGQMSIDRPHDLTQIGELKGQEGFWRERIAALKASTKLAEGKIAVFESVPDPYTALSYVCRGELLEQAEKSHPSFLEKALESTTAALKNYLAELAKQQCIDGLVVEIESATFEQREPEQFEALVKPHLKEMLNFFTTQSECPIWLHVRGSRVYLKPLLDLPHQAISWPHLSFGPKLDKALPRGYKGVIAGGINEQAVTDMSFQDIRRHVDEARDMEVDILCIGDHLPADISPTRLEALSNFLRKRDRKPEES